MGLRFWLSVLILAAAVGLVAMLASPTSGQTLNQPTVIVPATRRAMAYPAPATATPNAYPVPPSPTAPAFHPYVTPISLDATADLMLTFDAPTLVHRGGTVQVRYTVVNLGPGPTRGATFIAALPPSYYLDNVRVFMGWSCDVRNYSAVTLTRPITIVCQRDNWLLAKVPEDIRLDLTVTTSVLDRRFLGIQAAVLSTGIDNTPNWVLYAPGIK